MCQAILPMVVVLPVPLTPTISSTAGSPLRSIGALAVAATSARISISRARTASPSAGTLPPSTSCSSRSTTLAVVGAPASARISASSRCSQVSSSMRSKKLDEISSVSALRLLERLSRRRRKTPRRCSSDSGVAESFALSREPRLSISCQLVAIVAGRRGYLGGGAELLDGLAEVVGEPFHVRHGRAIGEQAEADAAVVADDRDRQRMATGEEADREHPGHLAAEHVEGDLRAREVGDEQVEESSREVDRRGGPQQEGRREVA